VGGVDLDDLAVLAVTGGRHRVLPAELGRTAVVKISEVQAIGRGGQALLGLAGEARGFQRALADLCATEPDCDVNCTSRAFWQEALAGEE